MSLALVRSWTLVGIRACPVDVEVHVGNGLPAFHIVGLPEAAVRESRDRVRAALLHAGFEFPNRRLTVNLAPADLPKDSGRFDLPIALGILAAGGRIDPTRVAAFEFVGELSLTGRLRSTRGALAIALGLARQAAGRGLVVPSADAAEVAVVPGLFACAADTLAQVVASLSGGAPLPAVAARDLAAADTDTPDLADVRGQAQARRALELAAAGGHSLLMVGPPGAGKSMLAARLPSILPPLTQAEALETGAIAALSGRFDPARLLRRPFRAPHHSASAAALIGGGSVPRPGEASLAHHGVLFLDELPEFPRAALEALREPLETGRVLISRAARQVDMPASFQFVAAMNPCPCGYLGDKRCHCTPDQVARYQRRVSGPLLDRVDLQITLARTDEKLMLAADAAEPSAAVAERVAAARTRQLQRQGRPNSALAPAGVVRWCRPDADASALLARAAARLRLSARSLHRVQRLARTIADLAGADAIGTAAVAEALGYRQQLAGTTGGEDASG